MLVTVPLCCWGIPWMLGHEDGWLQLVVVYWWGALSIVTPYNGPANSTRGCVSLPRPSAGPVHYWGRGRPRQNGVLALGSPVCHSLDASR